MKLLAQDLVISGEGSLDSQTLSGEAAAGVGLAAFSAGVPVVAACGQQKIDHALLTGIRIGQAYALSDIESNIRKWMDEAVDLLHATGMAVAKDWT